MAETVIGEGHHRAPTLTSAASTRGRDHPRRLQHPTGSLGDASRRSSDIYPNHESDAGLGSYRNAYAPFQDKTTDIVVLRAKYLLDLGKGLDLFGKIKLIDEQDDRLTEDRFLPFQTGNCPGGGAACANRARAYNAAGNSTAAIYGTR